MKGCNGNGLSLPPSGSRKEVEPLKYTEVAAAASVRWQTGKACILDTTSLVCHCLRKGEDVAFVLKDVGVLLIQGTGVQMKFYYDFLESINGKENLEKVVLKVPWLLDLVVSRVVAAASLMSSGRAVVFPTSNGSLHPAHRPGNPAGPQERRCPLSAGTRKVSSCWKVGGVTL
ncbi:coiled-coil domain-containing protein 81-like isoform X2 [Lagopus muta]|uniref:coiled-coil domain-containing protein 81-like isoform X2 n=1 Tax=Lagopus muta TaxID=64668 RepID=UPI0020A003A4|nr:coiled-coil domain-containing protein 81-like isoform X2 [Lagopus muta]